jgi:hypothetical protein
VSYRKFRNKKAWSRDGNEFHSKAERDRYEELRLLELGGAISDLKLQPEFELQPRYKYDGKWVARRKYRADFAYREPGNPRLVVEDVKGKETAVFSLKWAIVRYKYPDCDWRKVKMSRR